MIKSTQSEIQDLKLKEELLGQRMMKTQAGIDAHNEAFAQERKCLRDKLTVSMKPLEAYTIKASTTSKFHAVWNNLLPTLQACFLIGLLYS